MNNLSYSDIVSSLAWLTALGALAWNIIRDFVADRVAIDFCVVFGELGDIKNSTTGLFADAGSILPDHKFDNPSMLVRVTNVGRRPIGVAGVGGEYKSGKWFSMAVAGLPKMLQPYEIVSSFSGANLDFLEQVQKNEIERFWAVDTSGAKWPLSAKGWERLRRTADYINSKKNI